ncbi:hypothetical protein BT69DRAFT_1391124 [Atractiella rhizophila]|nr:hypothetical protein BT69DRAFT_1391124 [Atractiella rhizophila]
MMMKLWEWGEKKKDVAVARKEQKKQEAAGAAIKTIESSQQVHADLFLLHTFHNIGTNSSHRNPSPTCDLSARCNCHSPINHLPTPWADGENCAGDGAVEGMAPEVDNREVFPRITGNPYDKPSHRGHMMLKDRAQMMVGGAENWFRIEGEEEFGNESHLISLTGFVGYMRLSTQCWNFRNLSRCQALSSSFNSLDPSTIPSAHRIHPG